MLRFQHTKNTSSNRKIISSLLVFAMIIAVFYWCFGAISSSSDHQQKQNLQNALSRCISCCYAVEGQYPEDLEYIKKNYGLVYDENQFYVDYQVIGANIAPKVTIIERE